MYTLYDADGRQIGECDTLDEAREFLSDFPSGTVRDADSGEEIDPDDVEE